MQPFLDKIHRSRCQATRISQSDWFKLEHYVKSKHIKEHQLVKLLQPELGNDLTFVKGLLKIVPDDWNLLEELEVRIALEMSKGDTLPFTRGYVLPNGDILQIKESKLLVEQGTTALRTWEAALRLAETFMSPNTFMKPSKDSAVLELGSGTGFLALMTSWALKCTVVATDVTLAMKPDFLQDNISTNAHLLEKVPIVKSLNWIDYTQKDLKDILCQVLKAQPVDVWILATDVSFAPELFEPFFSLIDELLEKISLEASLLFAITERNPETYSQFLTHFDSLSKKYPNYTLNQSLLPLENAWWHHDEQSPVNLLYFHKQ
jgi:hypothetical protein